MIGVLLGRIHATTDCFASKGHLHPEYIFEIYLVCIFGTVASLHRTQRISVAVIG